jgi:hypothetical protein
MIIEALADAGVKYGLPRPIAYRLASKTLAGTGEMQLQTGMHPGAIKDGVCSPAGTTIRGVEALERAGVQGSEVLMVGNHNLEDGAATKLGCDLYLVTDYLIESEDGLNVQECKHGSMEDFARFCEELPSLT